MVGAVLGKHLPERVIQFGAAILFFVFGAVLFFEGLMPGTAAPYIAAGVVLAVSAVVVAILRRSRARSAREPVEQNTTGA